MPAPELFFDFSALFAGVASATGASRVLLMLGKAGAVRITVSEQVIAETERAVARKATAALPYYRQSLRAARLQIVRDPLPAEIAAHAGLTSHAADIPILVAAMKVQTGFLVTLNRRHFVDDPAVAVRAGLRIGDLPRSEAEGAPAEALAWVRDQLAATGGPELP